MPLPITSIGAVVRRGSFLTMTARRPVQCEIWDPKNGKLVVDQKMNFMETSLALTPNAALSMFSTWFPRKDLTRWFRSGLPL